MLPSLTNLFDPARALIHVEFTAKGRRNTSLTNASALYVKRTPRRFPLRTPPMGSSIRTSEPAARKNEPTHSTRHHPPNPSVLFSHLFVRPVL
ncbi:hypothetical protein D9613_002530 [Agrocybe pediades]|uniref:Uncharacterized protein n=1 Tax=Agrocybe pediades TaxID=84607 RepID=A0A8H4QP45_9AGAR|nr:hypothetical protein D9613_002530 [Agrocybe pediades]